MKSETARLTTYDVLNGAHLILACDKAPFSADRPLIYVWYGGLYVERYVLNRGKWYQVPDVIGLSEPGNIQIAHNMISRHLSARYEHDAIYESVRP